VQVKSALVFFLPAFSCSICCSHCISIFFNLSVVLLALLSVFPNSLASQNCVNAFCNADFNWILCVICVSEDVGMYGVVDAADIVSNHTPVLHTSYCTYKFPNSNFTFDRILNFVFSK
jgi:hypothetical protein